MPHYGPFAPVGQVIRLRPSHRLALVSVLAAGLLGSTLTPATFAKPIPEAMAADSCRIAPSPVLDLMSAFFASLDQAEMLAFNQHDDRCLAALASTTEAGQIVQRLREQQAEYPNTTLRLQSAVESAGPLGKGGCATIQATVALDVAYIPTGRSVAPASNHFQVTRVFTVANSAPDNNNPDYTPDEAHLTAIADQLITPGPLQGANGPFGAALSGAVDRGVTQGPTSSYRPVFTPAIAQNGFVIDGASGSLNFFGGPSDAYGDNSYQSIPSFITIDAGLHAFHVLFDRTLLAAESSTFEPRLIALLSGLVRANTAQRATLGAPDWQTANAANAAYLAVALRLLGGTVPAGGVPAAQATVVDQEVALVRHHTTAARSPFLGQQVDYRLFTPRGHYNYGPELQAYFMAMNWLALMQAPLQAGEGVTPDSARAGSRRAVVLAALFEGGAAGSAALRQWHQLADPIAVLIGAPSGPTLTDLIALAQRVYGPSPSSAALQSAARLAAFQAGVPSLPAPAYLSTASVGGRGVALFPARIIPDGVLGAALTWPYVGTSAHMRLLPSGLDVLAALGSTRAAQRAAQAGPWANYQAALAQAVPPFRRALQAPTLYAHWLATLQPLAQPVPRAAPPVMRTAAWADKELMTAAASWSELRHDSLLYAGQTAGLGGIPPCGLFFSQILRTGYVEPIPAAWQRLAALAEQLAAVTNRFALFSGLSARDQTALRTAEEQYSQGLGALGAIAEAELRGRQLSASQALLTMDNSAYSILGTPMQVFFTQTPHPLFDPQAQQAAEIADVATSATTGQVLEVGEGRVQPIWLVVPIGPWQWLARGGVYSYYEFTTSGTRYTDQAWRQLLQNDPQAMRQPSWIEALER